MRTIAVNTKRCRGLLIAVMSIIVLSSCAARNDYRGGSADNVLSRSQLAANARVTPASERSLLVIRNLVSTLRQVPQLEPHLTSISIRKPRSRFARLLVAELQETGYRIYLARGAQAPNLLEHSINRLSSSREGRLYEFNLSINGVGLKRTYELQRDTVVPVSAMRIAGTDPTGIEVDDTLFEKTGVINPPATSDGNETFKPLAQQTSSGFDEPLINYSSDQELAMQRTNVATASAVIAPVDQDAFAVTADEIAGQEQMPGSPGSNLHESQPDRLLTGSSGKGEAVMAGVQLDRELNPLINMYELGHSNYAQRTSDLDDVKKVVLVFEDDSLVLRRNNKQLARQLVEQYQPDTDVFSVIGCSHGKSSAPGGNRGLALGRASRVREELIMAGINPTRILDEGCWAGRSYRKMPARAVLLTLKRQRNAPG